MVAKIARFEWEIPGIIHETRAYMLLEGTGLAPRFLGHIQEHGRVIGFLLEKVDRMRRAGLSDLARCRDALRAFHQITAMQHGDVNRHNFLVSDGERGKVVLIDFERSRSFSCGKKGAANGEGNSAVDGTTDRGDRPGRWLHFRVGGRG